MSRPSTLQLPLRSSRLDIHTARGPFAAINCEAPEAMPHCPTAVLIPGFTGSKEDFIEVIGPLRDAGRRVVALDLRGQYESAGTNDSSEYALDALAADLIATIDAIGDPVHLVGHSFGGFVARVAARQVADSPASWRVQSLVLLDSGPGRITGQALGDLELLRQALTSMDMASLWELKRDLERSRGDVDPPEPVASFMRERFVRTHQRSLLAAAADLSADVDRLEPLVGTDIPVMVMYGSAEDVWTPEALAAMAQTIGARASVIEGAGHSPAVDDPAATVGALGAFWDDVEGVRASGRLDERADSVGNELHGDR